MILRQQGRTRSVACLFSFFIGCVLLPATIGRGETAQWAEPDIDTWVYVNGFGAGTRAVAPAFSGLFMDAPSQQFVTSTLQSPARLGSMMVAFETSTTIATGLEPGQYAISSVTLTARSKNGTSGSLLYTDQPITPTGLLAEALGAGITPQQPMELFGVGFRDGYEGFDLGGNVGTTLFSEATAPNSASDGGYVVHPLIGDGTGGYSDVLNNITGGGSATEATGQTNPFTATPWAIGTTGLSVGQTVPNNTTFAYSVDLTLPGVLDYLQTSLSGGSLGFFLSSMHPAEQPGTGGGGGNIYPQWYAKESVGVFPGAEAATLSIEYSILSEFDTGDYNRDGNVDLSDYSLWQTAFGTTVATAGDGADGNSDGGVDTADYTVWRDNAAVSAIAVPEPGSAALLLAATTMAFLGQRKRA